MFKATILILFNSLSSLVKGLGFKQVDKYFNDPERPEQLIQAENEMLRGQVEQAKAIIEQLQAKNPIAEAEQVKANASMQNKIFDLQSKQAIDAAKLAENQRQFDIKVNQEKIEDRKRLEFDLTKLEADTGQNIPGSVI